jgi:hypothetical protein
MDVVKVGRDDTHVSMAILCCNILFKMFHLF